MTATTEEQIATQTSRRRLRIVLMYILPPLLAVGIVLVPMITTATILPRLGASPGFALVDQNGEAVTSESLRGDIIVFGIASLDCAKACQVAIESMRSLQGELSDIAGDEEFRVRLVTIVVDGTENPEVLRRFAEEQGIAGANWSVLSGSESNVRATAGSGFEVYVGQDADGSVVHDPGVFLTDHAGFMRAEYRSTPRADVIGGDIERIIDEATAGGIGGLFYNAAHSLSLSCGG